MSIVADFVTAPPKRPAPKALTWVLESRVVSVVWLAMRVWLGIMWMQAGWAKIWGAENAGFLHHDGAGVAGFATHGAAAYTWWHSFLTGFVVPNSGAIGILVAFGELAIGIALVAGFFTRFAALASLGLLFTYVMSGTASVCAWYALFALVVFATYRTSSWIGVDGVIASYRQRHHTEAHHMHLPWDQRAPRPVVTPAPVASTPVGATPVGATPVGAAPVAATPVATIALASTPVVAGSTAP